MRKLNPDEEALWARVTQAVRRLERGPEARSPWAKARDAERISVSLDASEAGEVAQPAPAPRIKGRVPPVRQPAARPAPPPGPGTLDGSWDRRLASGRTSVDRVVDLHGHDLDGAWSLIDRELDDALAAGERVLLLITGKPPRDMRPHVRGRIRAAVDGWLHASRHAPRIAAVRPAAHRHGGAGALYIVLRRNKD